MPIEETILRRLPGPARGTHGGDWYYGKIFAVHLRPQGASYSGSFETFVSGKPLAVTSLDFGRDGAMYFIIGGWRMQSGRYRVSSAGPPQAEPPPTAADLAERERADGRRRRRLAGETKPMKRMHDAIPVDAS
jgi:hypothetical protein